MVENAAKINYKYGEMAAENAFERQQVLYDRTYQDQSYANQVAQMDAAGLSPGLMYGKGGAGGGGAGSTTGAPMGATGATGAGSAADPNMQLQALMVIERVRRAVKRRNGSRRLNEKIIKSIPLMQIANFDIKQIPLGGPSNERVLDRVGNLTAFEIDLLQ